MAKVLRDAFSTLVARSAASIPAGSSLVSVITAQGSALLRELIKQAQLTDLAGPEKRALVLEYVSQWYDRVIPALPLPLPIWLAWLRPMIRPHVKALAMEAAGQLLERILASFKEDGVLT